MNWQAVKTKNVSAVSQTVSAARSMGDMLCVTGETGTGKTYAAELLSQKVKNTYYLLGDVTTTKASFVDGLIKSVNVGASVKTLSAKMNAVVNHLCSLDGRAVVIIDDVGKLKNSVLQMIQVLYDRIQGNAGIVLLGTPALRTKIKKDVVAQRGFMPELSGRIGHWSSITHQDSGIKEICEANGVTDGCATYIANITKSLHVATKMVKKTLIAASGKEANEKVLSEINKTIDWHDKVVTK
jgi:energy-coupling factor transporter ATP-binding protein EcfA2